MDLSFYVLLSLACLVLLLAMWACAASGTPTWGPDTTLHLPPDVLRDAIARALGVASREKVGLSDREASAPTELQHEPLLRHAEPMGPRSCTMVRVLPAAPHRPVQQAVRPVFCTFSTEARA